MVLSLSRVSHFVIGLTFLILNSPVYGQFEEMANANADSVETSRLVAKSPIVRTITDKELTERLGQLSGCLDLRNTKVVKSYITHYLYRPEKTRSILSRRATFFPLFERKLKEYGVPDDLKYLSVVESALNAKAVSRVGASGLWQFMPATGIDYGMAINGAVDERNNIVKSTEGAAKYLKHLYNQYNDWALALAAYNSGPSRVNSAIRRAGSKNFWVIQRYLPEETRNYVPAFIAATYICNFFSDHNIAPDYPELDQQIIEHILVFDGISFSAISKATGISYQTVSDLNPGFKRAYIPPSKKGYYVTLPRRVMPALVKHLNTLGGVTYRLDAEEYSVGSEVPGNSDYYYTMVTVPETDLLDRFAAKIGCNGAQLRAWNNLPSHFVYANQTLKIWHPVPVLRHTAEIKSATTAAKSTVIVETVSTPQPPVTKKPAAPQQQWLFHKAKKGDSIGSIARRYGISEDALQTLNNTADIKPGMLIKIKEIK